MTCHTKLRSGGGSNNSSSSSSSSDGDDGDKLIAMLRSRIQFCN